MGHGQLNHRFPVYLAPFQHEKSVTDRSRKALTSQRLGAAFHLLLQLQPSAEIGGGLNYETL